MEIKTSFTTYEEENTQEEPEYDPKADARLQRHIENEQKRIDAYIKAMGNAHNRQSKRAAKKHLRKRGKGYTK